MDLRERERAEEAHWVLLQEEMFRLRMHRDLQWGLWLARWMGLSGQDAQLYALALMTADVEGGEEALIGRAMADRVVRHRLSEDELRDALHWFARHGDEGIPLTAQSRMHRPPLAH